MADPLTLGLVGAAALVALAAAWLSIPRPPELAVKPEGRPSRIWPATLVGIAMGLMAHLVPFSGTATLILQAWGEKDVHNYGFLIVPVSIFLLWRRWHATPPWSGASRGYGNCER